MALRVEIVAAEAVPPDVLAVGVPVFQGDEGPVVAAGLPPAVAGLAVPTELDAEWCRRQGFKAKVGQVLAVGGGPGSARVVAVGLGPADRLDAEVWRRASADLVRDAGEDGGAALLLPAEPGVAAEVLGAAVTEGAVLAAYRYDEYRSRPGPGAPEQLLVVAADPTDEPLQRGAARGRRTAAATAFARDLVNTPASDLTPRRLADVVAEHLAGVERTTVEIWDEGRIAEEHLGALLGVARGSSEPPRLIRVDYEPVDPVAVEDRVPHVVLVGKGITFDSGGLSLKTPEGMTTMKTDMSGAAAVLSAVAACADLGVRVRVTALAPVTENMPSGSAIKPGDVLKTRSGQTIEVLNTDAEGRLVLADALSLAVELEPDAIVDLATLTGAAVVALGRSVGALFGSDDELVARVRVAGDRAGEPLWPLPLPDDYADHIDSDVADMKNTGVAGEAGSIAAAMLLSRFTTGVPWAHLDIAGPARASSASGYRTKGGTGFGVRTLLELLASYGEA